MMMMMMMMTPANQFMLYAANDKNDKKIVVIDRPIQASNLFSHYLAKRASITIEFPQSSCKA
jgi:hypothetical protein